MKIPDKYNTQRIPSKETYPWLLKKHYAHRIPSISYSFGLYSESTLMGICTFGMPPMSNVSFIHDDIKMNDILELNRLCVEENLERNVLSYFVSSCIKQIENNLVLISYADTTVNHSGYIYQATNWIYTGLGSIGTCEYVFQDRTTHSRHLNKKEFFGPRKLPFNDNKSVNENFTNVGGVIIKNKPKHRYLYINGDKKFKKNILRGLNCPILPYPKGENIRYDSSSTVEKQITLF